MILIGITGAAGAGKDTVGAILRDRHQVTTTAFADPIKKMLCTLLGVDFEKWEDRAWKEEKFPGMGKSPRQMAQTLGTEWGRDYVSSDIWIDHALNRWQDHVRWYPGFTGGHAITDVRFENESQAIRNKGGYILHVRRVEGTVNLTEAHSSENGVIVHRNDFLVNNYGSFDDLESQVGWVYDLILQLGASS